jgi:hypothetical protein
MLILQETGTPFTEAQLDQPSKSLPILLIGATPSLMRWLTATM